MKLFFVSCLLTSRILPNCFRRRCMTCSLSLIIMPEHIIRQKHKKVEETAGQGTMPCPDQYYEWSSQNNISFFPFLELIKQWTAVDITAQQQSQMGRTFHFAMDSMIAMHATDRNQEWIEQKICVSFMPIFSWVMEIGGLLTCHILILSSPKWMVPIFL